MSIQPKVGLRLCPQRALLVNNQGQEQAALIFQEGRGSTPYDTMWCTMLSGTYLKLYIKLTKNWAMKA